MNNTTPKDNMQGLNPDQIMSSLAFATHIHEQSLPKDMPSQEAPPEAPQAPQDAVEPTTEDMAQKGQEEPQKEEKTGKEIEDLAKGFEEFKGEVKGIIDTKFDGLTQTIKDALGGK